MTQSNKVDVVIGIGRGRQADENYIADETAWNAFRADIIGISAELGTVNAMNHGTTESPEWGIEAGYWVAATIPAGSIDALTSALRTLAAQWRQDAIALTVGQTTLVGAE